MSKMITQVVCWSVLSLIVSLESSCVSNKNHYSQFVPPPGQLRKGETVYVKNDPKCPGAVRVVVGGENAGLVKIDRKDSCMPCPKEEVCP